MAKQTILTANQTIQIIYSPIEWFACLFEIFTHLFEQLIKPFKSFIHPFEWFACPFEIFTCLFKQLTKLFK